MTLHHSTSTTTDLDTTPRPHGQWAWGGAPLGQWAWGGAPLGQWAWGGAPQA